MVGAVGTTGVAVMGDDAGLFVSPLPVPACATTVTVYAVAFVRPLTTQFTSPVHVNVVVPSVADTVEPV
jgi:hypothetical protein